MIFGNSLLMENTLSFDFTSTFDRTRWGWKPVQCSHQTLAFRFIVNSDLMKWKNVENLLCHSTDTCDENNECKVNFKFIFGFSFSTDSFNILIFAVCSILINNRLLMYFPLVCVTNFFPSCINWMIFYVLPSLPFFKSEFNIH